MAPETVTAMTIHADDGSPIVDVHQDGRVVVHDETKLDEAAQKFWAAIEKWAPPGLATPPSAV